KEEKEILSNINLTLEEGEFHCLLGRSGCGKTTLLKLAAGLLQPTGGKILLEGQDVTEPTDGTAFVFQEQSLLRWKTVLDNVLLPIALQKKVTEASMDKAYELLALMGIEEYANDFPRHLSGGQQARVAIARALMMNPSLLFMDEPFADLDAITREELQRDLLYLCRQEKMTVLFITHDIAEAVYLADVITIMEAGEITASFDCPEAEAGLEDWRYSYEFMEQCRHVQEELERKKSE